MIFRFGRFELDEEKRELRLEGRVREIQPRVFDLLLYLVRHRERVVSKDELFSAIWPDVVVTDSSIMRAASLIRTLLREGDLPEALQTYSRQGYRFTAEVGDGRAPKPVPPSPEVAKARAAYEKEDWPKALTLFRAVRQPGRLGAEDFEHWARTALYLGRPNDAIAPLEQAVAAFGEKSDRVGAARAALALTNIHLEDRGLPVAKGWHRRATAFLGEAGGETSEHSLCAWLTARIALFEGDLPAALEHAKKAESMARRVDDPNVEALGLIYRAHVELATGQIRLGLLHMDEAGATVLAGTLSPWVSGFVFCSVIWAYLDRGDLGRAGQWTDQFCRWSRRYLSYGYPGLCRMHKGEVLCAQGKLQEAEHEITEALKLLAQSARYAEGDACRILGEIRLLRGDEAGADEAFRQAHELGWNPLPGRALLAAERGNFDAAIKALQRGLDFPSWADGQRRGILLAHLTRIACFAGKRALATKSLRELARASTLRSTPGCEAFYQQAAAEVAVMERDYERAIVVLRQALTVWLDVGSPINAAHVRLRLAEVLLLAGDSDEAELELSSAAKAFSRMNATPMVRRCETLLRDVAARVES